VRGGVWGCGCNLWNGGLARGMSMEAGGELRLIWGGDIEEAPGGEARRTLSKGCGGEAGGGVMAASWG
jgi:hypothetical protein